MVTLPGIIIKVTPLNFLPEVIKLPQITAPFLRYDHPPFTFLLRDTTKKMNEENAESNEIVTSALIRPLT